VLGTDYSQELISGFAWSAVRLVYQQRGHLKVAFGEPSATLDASSAACKGGVAVSVPVEEGAAYAWGGAAWEGVSALTAAELDAALAMKQNEVANVTKIERAQKQVHEAYGRKGYLTARWRERREFSEGDRRVVFRFDVTEGPQFRMGALDVTGLPEAEAERVRAQWRLKPGDVFDASHQREFLDRAVRLLFKPGEKPWRVETRLKPDAGKLTADVTVNFTR
jgi:outer membrane protein assembly factor BamA